jgi:hypothetical protein
MPELPEDVITDAERLTRLAREAVDDNEIEAYRERRERIVSEYDFTARVREEDDTLVIHPDEWLEDGVVRIERIEDTDRAVEVSLSGPGDPDDWNAVEEHNANLVDAVADEHGEVHRTNARAFADFMGNHYARRVESASAQELKEFLEEYYPRNAWPSETERAVVGESLELLFDTADAEVPDFTVEPR